MTQPPGSRPGGGSRAGESATGGGRTTMRDMLVDAERRLSAAGVPSPASEAAAIAAHILGIPRGRLILQDGFAEDHRIQFETLVARRCSRIPLQHLLGTASFRRIEVAVGPGVFVPRPETEIVAGAAIRVLGEAPDRLAVDLCTGSGVIALSLALEVPSSTVHAVEVDPDAYAWAQRNLDSHAERLAEVGSDVVLHLADATTCVDGPLADLAGRVSVVAGNPPYIPRHAIPRDPEVRLHDPARALYGGDDGLDIVRGVVASAARLLRPGGFLVIEHADTQGERADTVGLPGLLREGGEWTSVRDHTDLAGLPRFTSAVRAGDAGSR